jgi:hypothetical protein
MADELERDEKLTRQIQPRSAGQGRCQDAALLERSLF